MKILKNFGMVAMVTSLSAGLYATTASINDRFYRAIRTDDHKAIAKLLAGGANVNSPDNRGNTPLMYAAAAGTPEMMRQLIAGGANVNAKNNFDATALLWSANQLEKVKLLVEKGADVNARSKQGRTPLLVATTYAGNIEVVRFLLGKGADLAKAREGANTSPLVEAAAANDIPTLHLMLERGEAVNAKNAGGFTALMFASGYGNVEMVKMLLQRGAEVNVATAPSYGMPVKNGPIALGHLTPLMLAVLSGSSEATSLLLEAGADVNAKDVRGMTPLMMAVATDHANEPVVKMLLAKGPATDVRSKANETALMWAAKFQHPAIMAAIREASPDMELTRPARPAVQPAHMEKIDGAVEKSLGLLQKTNVTFFKEGGCLSCHAQNITSIATAAVRSKGVHFDREAAAEVERGTRLQFAAFGDGMLERLDPPAVEILTYALWAISAGGGEPDRVTDNVVLDIAAQQHPDGSWGSAGIVRAPMSDGRYSTTATAIRSLRDFAPPARQAEMQERIAKGAKWLLAAETWTTEDAVMQLLGAQWAGLDRGTIDRLAKKVMALQREDGGWAQTPHLLADAYATGTALYALRESDSLQPADAAYQKGVAYLLATQAADGSWFVASRSPKFQPYFEGGFPYGHDQWISQMATGWASTALSLAIPDARASR